MSMIVAVDDEKMVTSAFKTLFKVEGYSDINLFNNPEEALEFLKTNKGIMSPKNWNCTKDHNLVFSLMQLLLLVVTVKIIS